MRQHEDVAIFVNRNWLHLLVQVSKLEVQWSTAKSEVPILPEA